MASILKSICGDGKIQENGELRGCTGIPEKKELISEHIARESQPGKGGI